MTQKEFFEKYGYLENTLQIPPRKRIDVLLFDCWTTLKAHNRESIARAERMRARVIETLKYCAVSKPVSDQIKDDIQGFIDFLKGE